MPFCFMEMCLVHKTHMEVDYVNHILWIIKATGPGPGPGEYTSPGQTDPASLRCQGPAEGYLVREKPTGILGS